MSQLWFYNSTRVPSKIKDICAISIVESQDINRFEYSDTMARFKVESIMKENNMKGASNGVDKKTGKNKHYAIKTSCLRRDKIPLEPPEIVETQSILMNRVSEKDLLLKLSPANDTIKNIVSTLCI